MMNRIYGQGRTSLHYSWHWKLERTSVNGRRSATSLSGQEPVVCAAGSGSCDRQGCEQLDGFPLASLQRGLGRESEWKQPPFPSGGRGGGCSGALGPTLSPPREEAGLRLLFLRPRRLLRAAGRLLLGLTGSFFLFLLFKFHLLCQ